MHEIEAKVHISKGDFLRLKKELDKTAVFKGEALKTDTYYGDRKNMYIRIRECDGKSFLGIKDKGNTKKGIEANMEAEWDITDKNGFEKFLIKIGIKPHIKKFKKTLAYQFRGFNIELNYVKKLGYFLEIEKILSSKKNIQKTKKELVDIFRHFGFSQRQFEKKYYLDLLQGK